MDESITCAIVFVIQNCCCEWSAIEEFTVCKCQDGGHLVWDNVATLLGPDSICSYSDACVIEKLVVASCKSALCTCTS